MRDIKKYATELLFPRACPICGDLLGNKGYICGDCRFLLSPVSFPACLICGCEIDDEEKELCEDCSRRERSYLRGFPALNYAGEIRDAVAGFKYHGKKYYADFFADEIIRRHGAAICEIAPEALIPVPIHKRKLKTRGYNQAELLAKALSRRIKIPVDSGLVTRCINTLPQKNLGDMEREKNLKRAFISSDKIVKYNKVMIVDDIYTTGATVEALTRVLKGMGVNEVFYTSICIGKGN